LDDVRLCVLVSGTGTILEAMLRAGLEVALVASDRRCRGLDVAFGAGVETLLVSREEFGGFAKSFDREGFTDELTNALKFRDIDLVAMAGFGTIVTGPSTGPIPDGSSIPIRACSRPLRAGTP
jgi:phosphoribosylglycinamide formyltransferase-1